MSTPAHLLRPVPPTAAEAEALADCSRLEGCVAKLRRAVETRDGRAADLALTEASLYWSRLQSYRWQRAARGVA